MALIFLTCFNGQAPVLFPDISYSFYPVYCELYDLNYEMIPLNEHFEIIKEDYYKENSGIIFPNPNAPTGLLVSLDFIEDILKHNQNSIVVVDEAYIDFGGESAVTLLEKYPHLLITQTFSKFRSLAGIRLGVALSLIHIYSWALINLIAAMTTVILGIVIIFLKKNMESNQEEGLTYQKRYIWMKLLGIAIAIISVVIFILTEDIALPMVMLDKYTVVMVVIAIIQFVVFFTHTIVKKKVNKQISQA